MSRGDLLNTARKTFLKIWDTAVKLRRIGKKDRRATPPKGGDGREHNRRIGTGKKNKESGGY